MCGRGLRLLPQGHVQYGVGKSVGVGFVARGRAEAVCPVEALRPFVLFIDIHSCHPLFADGEGEQCPSQSAAEKVGMYEEHFEVVARQAGRR